MYVYNLSMKFDYEEQRNAWNFEETEKRAKKRQESKFLSFIERFRNRSFGKFYYNKIDALKLLVLTIIMIAAFFGLKNSMGLNTKGFRSDSDILKNMHDIHRSDFDIVSTVDGQYNKNIKLYTFKSKQDNITCYGYSTNDSYFNNDYYQQFLKYAVSHSEYRSQILSNASIIENYNYPDKDNNDYSGTKKNNNFYLTDYQVYFTANSLSAAKSYAEIVWNVIAEFEQKYNYYFFIEIKNSKGESIIGLRCNEHNDINSKEKFIEIVERNWK